MWDAWDDVCVWPGPPRSLFLVWFTGGFGGGGVCPSPTPETTVLGWGPHSRPQRRICVPVT